VRDGRICERRASAVVLMQLRLRKVNSPMATEVILIEWPSPLQPIPVISRTRNGTCIGRFVPELMRRADGRGRTRTSE